MATRKKVTKKTKKKPFRVLEEYTDLLKYQQRFVTEAFIDKLCQDYAKWSQNPTSRVIHDFSASIGIYPERFRNWCKKYPRLSEVHKYVKCVLAGRRESGALTGEMKEKTVLFSQALYDKDWWQLEKDRAELKNVAPEQKETEFHIHLPEVEKVIPDKE